MNPLADRLRPTKLSEFIGKKIEVPEEVQKLIEAREKAWEEKDFKRLDELRKEIKKLGYEVEDSSSGTTIKKFSK